MTARVVGVTIRCEPKRALPWGLYVDTYIGGKRVGGSRFFATEAEAEAQYPTVAAEITRRRQAAAEQARLDKAMKVPPPLPTAGKDTELFETMATRWLEKRVKVRLTPSTYRGYKGLMERHLFPIMRAWPVTSTVMTVERLTDVLGPQLSAKKVKLPTRLACQRCLSAFFRWVIKAGAPSLFPHRVNPVKDLVSEVIQDAEIHIALTQEPNPMTGTQVEAFLAWQQEHYPTLYELFLWLAYEGSRIGEACALQWDRVYLDREKAHIVATYSGAQRWLDRQAGLETLGEKDTKTHRTNQYIDLHPLVVEKMAALKTRNLEAWMKRGRFGKAPTHCFLNSTLHPRRPDKIVYRAFREACTALKLVGQTGKPFTIHCLRDTFVTLSILAGGHDYGWVAMMLGHSKEDTLKKHYLKWIRLVDENPMAKGHRG
jgi:integrase